MRKKNVKSKKNNIEQKVFLAFKIVKKRNNMETICVSLQLATETHTSLFTTMQKKGSRKHNKQSNKQRHEYVIFLKSSSHCSSYGEQQHYQPQHTHNALFEVYIALAVNLTRSSVNRTPKKRYTYKKCIGIQQKTNESLHTKQQQDERMRWKK